MMAIRSSGSLLIGLVFGCTAQRPPSEPQSPAVAPKTAPPVATPAVTPPSRPTSDLVFLGADGVVRVSDARGKAKAVLGQGHRGARLHCAHQGNHVVVVSPGEARRYPTEEGATERLDMPMLSFCKGDSFCRVHRLTADAAADTLCAEISDGPPATATSSAIVRIRFVSPREAKAGECLVESVPEPSVLSADGQFSVRVEEGSCGDYCYQTVVIVDEHASKIVKSIEDVPVATPIEWAPHGSGLLIGGTLHDASQAELSFELGPDACWLRQ